MRAVIQRVKRASVSVNGAVCGSIGGGLLVLLGVGADDSESEAEKLAQKLTSLRIFADENGKTNLSLEDVGGELLVISQFTLYADCRKGTRPNFLLAKKNDDAEKLYEYFCGLCSREAHTERGIFGADMSVELINDGPFTIVLECRNGTIVCE